MADRDQGPATGGAAGRVRASDAERDDVIETLRVAHAAGRLDAAEFNERMEAALRARFLDELDPLLGDLPGSPRPGAPHRDPNVSDTGEDPAGWAPPWARPRRGSGPWPGPRFPVRLLPLLALFIVLGSVGAAAHGHFPWPLLWAVAALWWFRGGARWGRRRAAAGRR